jgi:Bacteriocin-protection, YdeI or OmpD-Associated
MSHTKISSGVVHELPADSKKALIANPQALTAWEDITPLARNEWICWTESAKKAETRSRRIEWGCSSLKDGKRRPVVGPDAPTANSKMVKIGHCDGLAQFPGCASYWI